MVAEADDMYICQELWQELSSCTRRCPKPEQSCRPNLLQVADRWSWKGMDSFVHRDISKS